jgi:hypothetical protein
VLGRTAVCWALTLALGENAEECEHDAPHGRATQQGENMTAMAAPIVPGKEDVWRAWMAELTGPRKAELSASNDRHGLTAHHAWLQANPDGSHVAIVVHDGPGADAYLGSMAQSTDAFDQWFIGKVAEVHGMDLGGPLPPPAEQVL